MRNSDESVHGDGSRGSGRTHRQLASLREGDYFITGNRDHAHLILRKLGMFGRVHVLGLRDANDRTDQLRGLNGPWVEVDHYIMERPSQISERLSKLIEYANWRATK